MPTLGEFLSNVQSVVRLGNRVDALILSATRQAMLWLERNYNFRYMKTAEVVFFEATTGRGPYALVGMPKSVEGICVFDSITLTPSQIYWLDRIQLKDVDWFKTERPRAYEIRNQKEVWLNSFPDKLYYGQAFYWTYSTFPSLTTSTMYSSAASLWLVTYGEDVLLQQTLLQLGAMLKDEEMIAAARGLRDEALRTLVATEDTFAVADENMEMGYGGSFDA